MSTRYDRFQIFYGPNLRISKKSKCLERSQNVLICSLSEKVNACELDLLLVREIISIEQFFSLIDVREHHVVQQSPDSHDLFFVPLYETFIRQKDDEQTVLATPDRCACEATVTKGFLRQHVPTARTTRRAHPAKVSLSVARFDNCLSEQFHHRFWYYLTSQE